MVQKGNILLYIRKYRNESMKLIYSILQITLYFLYIIGNNTNLSDDYQDLVIIFNNCPVNLEERQEINVKMARLLDLWQITNFIKRVGIIEYKYSNENEIIIRFEGFQTMDNCYKLKFNDDEEINSNECIFNIDIMNGILNIIQEKCNEHTIFIFLDVISKESNTEFRNGMERHSIFEQIAIEDHFNFCDKSYEIFLQYINNFKDKNFIFYNIMHKKENTINSCVQYLVKITKGLCFFTRFIEHNCILTSTILYLFADDPENDRFVYGYDLLENNCDCKSVAHMNNCRYNSDLIFFTKRTKNFHFKKIEIGRILHDFNNEGYIKDQIINVIDNIITEINIMNITDNILLEKIWREINKNISCHGIVINKFMKESERKFDVDKKILKNFMERSIDNSIEIKELLKEEECQKGEFYYMLEDQIISRKELFSSDLEISSESIAPLYQFLRMIKITNVANVKDLNHDKMYLPVQLKPVDKFRYLLSLMHPVKVNLKIALVIAYVAKDFHHLLYKDAMEFMHNFKLNLEHFCETEIKHLKSYNAELEAYQQNLENVKNYFLTYEKLYKDFYVKNIRFNKNHFFLVVIDGLVKRNYTKITKKFCFKCNSTVKMKFFECPDNYNAMYLGEGHINNRAKISKCEVCKLIFSYQNSFISPKICKKCSNNEKKLNFEMLNLIHHVKKSYLCEKHCSNGEIRFIDSYSLSFNDFFLTNSLASIMNIIDETKLYEIFMNEDPIMIKIKKFLNLKKYDTKKYINIYSGKVVILNTLHIEKQLNAFLKIKEYNRCHLCNNEMLLNKMKCELQAFCGNKICKSGAHTACINIYYQDIFPGERIDALKLKCPSCYLPQQKFTFIDFNFKLSLLKNSYIKNLKEDEEYAWCKICYEIICLADFVSKEYENYLTDYDIINDKNNQNIVLKEEKEIVQISKNNKNAYICNKCNVFKMHFINKKCPMCNKMVIKNTANIFMQCDKEYEESQSSTFGCGTLWNWESGIIFTNFSDMLYEFAINRVDRNYYFQY